MIMDKFKSIFSGLEIAYGQYQPGERGNNGKQKGKAFIVRGQVTDELWSNHLEGKGPALGIIPIAEDNSCLLYTSPSPRDRTRSRMPSSA